MNDEIFGNDAIKVRSCILLFESVCNIPVFKQIKTNIIGKMELFKKLFGKQHDKEQEEKPVEYSVMYPQIEVVDLEDWKWGYNPFGYPEQKEASEEMGVWDIWPIIISRSYNLLVNKYKGKWEKPNNVPKFYHLRFSYNDKELRCIYSITGR